MRILLNFKYFLKILGETIWTRYTTPQIGNFQRVEDIQKTWHFSCTCARCCDPTGMNTISGTFICSDPTGMTTISVTLPVSVSDVLILKNWI